MQDLLRHYENELAFLHGHADEFAQRNPKIAGHLLLGRDAGEDPHVQRLVQSFALLSSRIHKRLDDDFPLFTEAFLEVLYPHYLRPFPSCSIAAFDTDAVAPQEGVVERGTPLRTQPVAGVACKFLTTQKVTLAPVRITSAGLRTGLDVPPGSPVPPGSSASIAIGLELASPQASWAGLGVDSLRIYLDGEPSQVSALREMLCGRTTAVLVETAAAAPWRLVDGLPSQVGFADDEALIEFDARSHPAYRLLTEYFAFPDKFDFVDLPLPGGAEASEVRHLTLHCVMQGLRGDSDKARLLETVTAKNLRLGCTPVVNLFPQKADPIRVTGTTTAYPVLADGRRAFGHEVHSVDRVYRVRHTAQGESVDEFKPFYSLQHDRLLSDGDAGGRYWSLHRNDTLAERSPGFETEIAIVDIDADPASPHTDTLSIDIRATNRDLPTRLSVGEAGGELVVEGAVSTRSIRLLKKPSPPRRFDRGHGALWRLVSHLSLNHLSLSAGGIDALRELLRLYDLPRSAANARQVDGLVAIDYRPASACLPGNPFATFVRGTEVRLTVDEQAFAGSGLRLFAEVLDRFFGLYVQANSFVQLLLVSSRSGDTVIACPRRSGDSPLL